MYGVVRRACLKAAASVSLHLEVVIATRLDMVWAQDFPVPKEVVPWAQEIFQPPAQNMHKDLCAHHEPYVRQPRDLSHSFAILSRKS